MVTLEVLEEQLLKTSIVRIMKTQIGLILFMGATLEEIRMLYSYESYFVITLQAKKKCIVGPAKIE